MLPVWMHQEVRSRLRVFWSVCDLYSSSQVSLAYVVADPQDPPLGTAYAS